MKNNLITHERKIKQIEILSNGNKGFLDSSEDEKNYIISLAVLEGKDWAFRSETSPKVLGKEKAIETFSIFLNEYNVTKI